MCTMTTVMVLVYHLYRDGICVPLWYRVPCVPWWYMCTVMVHVYRDGICVPCVPWWYLCTVCIVMVSCTVTVCVYDVYRDGIMCRPTMCTVMDLVYHVYRDGTCVPCVPRWYLCTVCIVIVPCTMCTVMVYMYHVYRDGMCVRCVPWRYHV